MLKKKLTIDGYINLIISVLAAAVVFISLNILFSFFTLNSPAVYPVNPLFVRIILDILFILLIFALIAAKIIYKRYAAKLEEKQNLIATLQNEIEKQNKVISNLTRLYNDVIEYDNMKTEFFSNISHELKTPLSVILGAIQLIEQKRANDSPEKRNADKSMITIKRNCYRMLRLINNILDVGRIDSGHINLNLINCNIVYLIEEIVQSVVLYAEQKGLNLEFDTECEEIITAVDIDKIERITLNLLSNAIKFTPSGGKIAVYVYSKNNRVFISIKDTGVGIPESMLKAIFERFRQVNSSLTRDFEGSGIGLSLVKSFVDLHNGSIEVKSEENKGSEFIVEIPIRLCESDKGDKSIPQYQNKIIEAINIEFSDIYSIAS